MVAPPTTKPSSGEAALLQFVLVAGSGSLLFWLAVRHTGAGVGRLATFLIFLLLGGYLLWSTFQRRYAACCCAVAYLTAIEPAIRVTGRGLPYLSLEYVFILAGLLTVLQRRARLHLPTLYLGLYALLEIAGGAVGAKSDESRWMMVMTSARFALFLLVQRACLRPEEMLRVLGAYLAGTLAMAGMGLQGSFSSDIQWSEQSNKLAAAAFGPNQVAGLLAFGAFCSVFLADLDQRLWARLLYLGLGGMQLLAALFTFTRGGGVIFGLGLLIYVLLLLACGRVSVAVVGMSAVVIIVAWVAIQVTDQMLLTRYQDSHLSRREDIWALGLRIFWEHPVLGVGTGNFYEASAGQLATYHGRVGTHNELIRALAEHGLVGASIWIAFILSGLARCWDEQRGLARAVTVCWLLMAVLFEFHSGLKLSMSMLFMALAVEGFHHLPGRAAASTIHRHVTGRHPRFQPMTASYQES